MAIYLLNYKYKRIIIDTGIFNMNKKKLLFICGGIVDLGITLFLFVIHIIMLVNITGKTDEELIALRNQDNLIGLLMRNNVLYLCAFVIPLFVILAINIVALVFYVRKQSAVKVHVEVKDLTDEQKEALKKEILKDLEK